MLSFYRLAFGQAHVLKRTLETAPLRRVLQITCFGYPFGDGDALTGIGSVGHHRLQRGRVQRQLAIKNSVFVCLQRTPVDDRAVPGIALGRVRTPINVLKCSLVRGNQARPRAAFDAHIADRHAAGHVEGPDGLAAVLENVAHAAAGAVLGDDRENDIFGRHTVSKRTLHVDGEGLRLLLHQALRRQDVTDLAGPNTERQRTERAVRAGVAVAAHDRHARLGDPQFGPNDMHDALDVTFNVEEWNTEVRAICSEGANLGGRIVRPVDLHGPDAGGNGMVHSGESLVRPAHRQAPFSKCGERLRGRDFVNQVGIDVEHGWRAFILRNHVRIPNLFE